MVVLPLPFLEALGVLFFLLPVCALVGIFGCDCLCRLEEPVELTTCSVFRDEDDIDDGSDNDDDDDEGGGTRDPCDIDGAEFQSMSTSKSMSMSKNRLESSVSMPDGEVTISDDWSIAKLSMRPSTSILNGV